MPRRPLLPLQRRPPPNCRRKLLPWQTWRHQCRRESRNRRPLRRQSLSRRQKLHRNRLLQRLLRNPLLLPQLQRSVFLMRPVSSMTKPSRPSSTWTKLSPRLPPRATRWTICRPTNAAFWNTKCAQRLSLGSLVANVPNATPKLRLLCQETIMISRTFLVLLIRHALLLLLPKKLLPPRKPLLPLGRPLLPLALAPLLRTCRLSAVARPPCSRRIRRPQMPIRVRSQHVRISLIRPSLQSAYAPFRFHRRESRIRRSLQFFR